LKIFQETKNIFSNFRYFSARRRKRYQLIPRVICQIWDFCSESAELLYPRGHVRLIVTRVGRIGAGETKEWAKIIPQGRTRKHKDDLNRTQIISALITSLEPDVTIRIIPEATRTTYASNTSSSKGSSDRVKTIPPVRIDEVQTAHVAVFATACNATKQSEQNNEGFDELDIDLDMGELKKNLNDPDGDNFAINMDDVMVGLEDDATDIEEVKGLELNQQPLAVALWISAAIMPSGMPNWFGPLNKNEPTAVRIALHIQGKSESDHAKSDHPLDSNRTVETLRYVVENLERLSWLTFRINGRTLNRTALPSHISALGGLHRQLTLLTNRVTNAGLTSANENQINNQSQNSLMSS
jgi:hypothetical protein